MGSIAELVRHSDRDRYTAALYAPDGKRDALMALYAFNVQIAGIRDAIKEPMAGEMRLQWWRDAIIGNSSTETAGNPVADALCGAIEAHSLPPAPFENMLEARRFDLYDDPMPSRNDLEGYCGETAGALFQLSCLVLNGDRAPGAADASGHAGCAYAIAGLLSLLPLHRRRGQCFVPAEILAACGIDRDVFVGGDPSPAAIQAVSAMIAMGRGHLNAFHKQAVHVPHTLRPAFLPVAGVEAWFGALGRAGPHVLDRMVKPSPLRISAAIFRRAMFGWR